MTNLATLLTDAAAAHPDAPAIRLGDTRVTYAELDSATAVVAAGLRAGGLQPGDTVGLQLPNLPDWVVLYYGVLRAGGVVVPMNPLLKAREVAFYLGDAGAVRFFAFAGMADEAAAGAVEAGLTAELVEAGEALARFAGVGPDPVLDERADDDTAVILYTSGTTGRPKGAELTHGSLRSNIEAIHLLFGTRPDDVLFGGLPLFHVFGQSCALNVAVRAGACLTLLPRFDPVVALELVAAHGVTIFEGVPTMHNALLHAYDPAVHDVSSVRFAASGGAALPVEVHQAYESTLGIPLLEGYGLSETSPVVSFNPLDRPRRPGTVGVPLDGVEVRIMAEDGSEVPTGGRGEIAVRGALVMKGYWRKPEATAAVLDAEGWFRTGDVGVFDADGYLTIVDRIKDLIIRGGYNVYPREIEEVLYEHPDVLEAAVIGVPHPELGEEVAAAVALRPGSTVDAEQLRKHVKAQVAAYKYPRHVWLVDALPTNATGKIAKREIVIPEGLTS
jgi:long-chain acyl-CoA synthetase